MSLRLGEKVISGVSRHTVSNSRLLLEFFWTDHLLNNMSYVNSLNFSWLDGNLYTSVYNLLVSEYQNGTEETEGSITFKRSPNGYKITTDESGVSALFNKTGVAWYYILDTTNKRFKLPRTKWGFKGLRDNPGDGIAESLPNITGKITANQLSDWMPEGAFKVYNAEATLNGGSNASRQRVDFDASRSSSTYQDGAPVQERATQMYLYFYVGEFSQTATEQTAGITAEVLNSKADTTTPSIQAPYLKTSYVNGTSGYNIWSNGYCEQWGYKNGATSETITFLKTFANTNYNVTMATKNASVYYQGVYTNMTVNGMTINYTGGSGGSANGCCWKVSGYLAQGEY